MTNYDVAFEEKQYRSVASRAAKYYQDSCDTSFIPLVVADVPDAYEYRYTYLTDPRASWAGHEWSEGGPRGTVLHDYTDIHLYTQQLNLYFNMNDYNKWGDSLIADKRGALIDKWAIDVDQAAIHGPKFVGGLTLAGTQLVEGLIGQLTSIQNLDGTDSTLNVKGDIWYALNTMIDGIPFAMRKEGPDMVMICDEYVVKEAMSPDRIYQDKIEWDFIKENLIVGGKNTIHPRAISKIVVSNKILAEASDDTDGDNADTVDTLGTHSRIMLIVPDPRWVGRIVSRGFSLVGENQTALGLEQIYGWKGRAYFFNTDCAEYSEAIQWS